MADLLEDQRKSEFNPADIFTTGDSDEEKRKEKKLKKEKRRDSLPDAVPKKEKEKKKEKDKKDKKKLNKLRKLSSEFPDEAEKKKRKKKHSEGDSNTSGPDSRTGPETSPLEFPPINMAGRKISEISGSSGSPGRPAPSASPESDLLSPDHSSITSEVLGDRPDGTDLDIKELDKSNQSVRERMEQMVKDKNRKNEKRKDKNKKRDSLKGRDKLFASTDLTQEAVRSLSFEIGSEKGRDETEKAGSSENHENSEEREQPNEELMAALAGLDSDFDFDRAKKEMPVEDKAPPGGATEPKSSPLKLPDQEVKIQVISNSANLLDKKFKRSIAGQSKVKEPLLSSIPNPLPVPATAPTPVPKSPTKVAKCADLIMPSISAGLPDEMKEFSDEEEFKIDPKKRKTPEAERRLSTVSCNSDTSGGTTLKPETMVPTVPLAIDRQQKRPLATAIGTPTIKLPGTKQPVIHSTVIQQPLQLQQPKQMTVLQIGQTGQSPISVRQTPAQPVHILKSPVALPTRTLPTGTMQATAPTRQQQQPTQNQKILIRSNPTNNVQLTPPTAQIQQQVLVQNQSTNQGLINVTTQGKNPVYRPVIRTITTQPAQIPTSGQGPVFLIILKSPNGNRRRFV